MLQLNIADLLSVSNMLGYTIIGLHFILSACFRTLSAEVYEFCYIVGGFKRKKQLFISWKILGIYHNIIVNIPNIIDQDIMDNITKTVYVLFTLW